MWLSDEERQKFAKWCEEHHRSNKAMIDQLGFDPMHKNLRERLNIESLSCQVVEVMLMGGEFQSISVEPAE